VLSCGQLFSLLRLSSSLKKTATKLAEQYRGVLPPNSEITVANNQTLAVPVPILQLILRHCVIPSFSSLPLPSSTTTTTITTMTTTPTATVSSSGDEDAAALAAGLIAPRDLYALSQVCRLFRSQVEPLLRQSLMQFSYYLCDDIDPRLRSRWVLSLHAEVVCCPFSSCESFDGSTLTWLSLANGFGASAAFVVFAADRISVFRALHRLLGLL
jgi:hypothetical protein